MFIQKYNLKVYILLIGISFLLLNCKRTTLIKEDLLTFKKNSQNSGKIMEDSSHKGHFFSRLDSTVRYGFIYKYNLTDNDIDADIKLVVSGKIRTNFVHTSGGIAFVLINKNEVVNWDGSNLRYHITDLNKWCYFKEVIKLNKCTTGYPYTRIEVQSMAGDSPKEYFDIDSVQIKLFKINY